MNDANATVIAPQPWFSDGERIDAPQAIAAQVAASGWRLWVRRVRATLAQCDVSDVLVTIGLFCVGRGCYLLRPAAGWIVPGVILLWIALPQRPRFLASKPPTVVTVESPRGGLRDGRV